jgi:hypothetical protein
LTNHDEHKLNFSPKYEYRLSEGFKVDSKKSEILEKKNGADLASK